MRDTTKAGKTKEARREGSWEIGKRRRASGKSGARVGRWALIIDHAPLGDSSVMPYLFFLQWASAFSHAEGRIHGTVNDTTQKRLNRSGDAVTTDFGALVLCREIGNLLPNNRRQRRTCYALCHILYPVSAAHTSIFRMDSTSTSYRCFVLNPHRRSPYLEHLWCDTRQATGELPGPRHSRR